MSRWTAPRRWCGRCERRRDCRRPTAADPDCDEAGRLQVRAQRSGADRADRAEARPIFRGDGGLSLDARGQVEDPGLGWDRDGADLQDPGTGQLYLAEGAGRHDAAVPGAGGSPVRRARLAAGGGAAGVAARCGRMTRRVYFGFVLLGFLSRIG
ncbi:UNVERIFIED_CONTAM: hypothetical protein NCL1_15981 [Trichonephila clavipes]